MNSATRTPAAASRSQALRIVPRPARTSRPPSVVSSARRSGTRQQSAGWISQAEVEHFARGRHFQVHARGEQAAQRAHVALLDMAAVLAQVQRDVVGAGLFGDQRGLHGIGIARAALLAQRRHVIDVDAQFELWTHQPSSLHSGHRARHRAHAQFAAVQTMIERGTQQRARLALPLGIAQWRFGGQRQQHPPFHGTGVIRALRQARGRRRGGNDRAASGSTARPAASLRRSLP